VWRRIAKELSDAENIVVIGYSLPEVDEFFRYLFRLGTVGDSLLRRFIVFDPDEAVRAHFTELLAADPGGRLQHIQVRFSDAIPHLKRFLGVE
jgi:hypothetical protein